MDRWTDRQQGFYRTFCKTRVQQDTWENKTTSQTKSDWFFFFGWKWYAGYFLCKYIKFISIFLIECTRLVYFPLLSESGICSTLQIFQALWVSITNLAFTFSIYNSYFLQLSSYLCWCQILMNYFRQWFCRE